MLAVFTAMTDQLKKPVKSQMNQYVLCSTEESMTKVGRWVRQSLILWTFSAGLGSNDVSITAQRTYAKNMNSRSCDRFSR
jgi:hypothetical protein